ncbi:hypothetical protein CH275_23445 [Rhodococcus sp. 06-235-1A]|nr:hypothetical protein CH275_23445 [Rhodococcus sp. 06-235-1A]
MSSISLQAIQISDEIQALAIAGYPFAAEARWRTLYELMVTARFLHHAPNATSARFNCSHIMELQRRVESGDYGNSSIAEPKERKIIERIQTNADKIVDKYGEKMKKPYGWAVQEIEVVGGRGFNGIHQYVSVFESLDIARYAAASHHVHAGRIGLAKTLQINTETGGINLGARAVGIMDILLQTVRCLSRILETLLLEAYKKNRKQETIHWIEMLDYCFDDAITEISREAINYDRNAAMKHFRAAAAKSSDLLGDIKFE